MEKPLTSVRRESMDLAGLCRHTAEDTAPLLAQAGIQLRYQPSTEGLLIPGDAAGDGLAVAVNDASTVVAGWLTGATKRNRIKGDIDESEFINSGNSGTADMTRVSNNLGKIRKSQTYDDFKANGSNTGMPTT